MQKQGVVSLYGWLLKWLRGLIGNQVEGLQSSVGSNPTPSAIHGQVAEMD